MIAHSAVVVNLLSRCNDTAVAAGYTHAEIGRHIG